MSFTKMSKTHRTVEGFTAMRKLWRVAGFLLAVLMIGLFSSKRAYADMGPKPSVNVTFENIGQRTIYASLYAKKGGPSPVSFGDIKDVDLSIQEIFSNYSKTEEARYVEDIWIIDAKNPTLDCRYMPPEEYKLVVYIPEENRLLESSFYTKVAFEQNYHVDLASVSLDGKVVLKEAPYMWVKAVLSLALRIFLTLAIEIGIALLFKIRGKKSILVLTITNIATQLLLNIPIMVIEYRSGGGLGMLVLIFFLELLIFAIEAVVYSLALKKTNEPPIKIDKAVGYAFVANLVSALAGIFLP